MHTDDQDSIETMRITIITVYQPFTNIGSFLQAYALQEVLKGMGHDVNFLRTSDHREEVWKLISQINPKRAILQRYLKTFYALRDLAKLDVVSIADARKSDIIIYGSDEIWNITNNFFKRPIFWGREFEDKIKIGYAVSIGHAENEDFKNSTPLLSNLPHFHSIFSRDLHTHHLLKDLIGMETEMVLDPTLLLPVQNLTLKKKVPSEKYLLVYTYGIDQEIIRVIKGFARRRNLQIISLFFWHSWADRTIESSALQFSSIIKGAEYVFSTTFHGAIFSLINHSKCAILPLRSKVKEITTLLGCESRIVSPNCTEKQFEEIITQPFTDDVFEEKLKALRNQSLRTLQQSLNNI